jgi:hypothetical protein
MNTRAMLLFGSLCAVCVPHVARCEDENLPARYDSRSNVNRPASEHYATPEDDGRPGEKFYFNAVRAVAKKDYVFALNMYQVSASWAYKPAQYNLGVMYLKGEGVPVDRPRAMAWMALASERGDVAYVQARELVYADLSKEEFARANEIWRELKPTYADESALARAKMRWAHVRAAMTGSHVGSVGNLKIGSSSGGVKPVNMTPSGKSEMNGFASAAFGVLGGGSEDGAIAYRQLRETNNPYDPKFEWHASPTPTGTVTVEPIVEGSAAEDALKAKPEPERKFF